MPKATDISHSLYVNDASPIKSIADVANVSLKNAQLQTFLRMRR